MALAKISSTLLIEVESVDNLVQFHILVGILSFFSINTW